MFREHDFDWGSVQGSCCLFYHMRTVACERGLRQLKLIVCDWNVMGRADLGGNPRVISLFF